MNKNAKKIEVNYQNIFNNSTHNNDDNINYDNFTSQQDHIYLFIWQRA